MSAPVRRTAATWDRPLAELEADLTARRIAEGVAAEQHHVLLDLDMDSQCRLPGCSPMCPPKGTEPPGGGHG